MEISRVVNIAVLVLLQIVLAILFLLIFLAIFNINTFVVSCNSVNNITVPERVRL